MQTKFIQQEEMSNHHHKDGSYFLTEFRTSTGRLMLSEGRSQKESEQGILNMLRDAPFKSRERNNKKKSNVFALFGRYQSASAN